ncbi:Serine/threonine protein kinase [Gordonia malaquae]|uniref:non-specific serine/threonine protein kinase n=1 Tax=Gordonia malaquae NBRC 108250 TaxID=1223542 RepID=M3TCX6_GORML|nr:protein kinase [Gordonia malaquae]GAC79241.1 hypothetical protein GM1_008_00030 [Gordonia malaquae NBRC 108250]SEE37042.1 Serine/threonine protein kinase [Gordonia malaquae]
MNSQLTAGDEFAGYRIINLIGRGGMGRVYLVDNPRLGRREALKVVSSPDSEAFTHRFLREVKTSAALDHPGIATVYHYGVDSGLPWFTMRYAPGDITARLPLRPMDVAQIVSSVASALDYAHSRQVIHRDIKPANISVGRRPDGSIDRVTVLDFGIARSADQTRLTSTGAFIGSIAYSAPESLTGGTTGPATDQYALACTAVELLTGAPPFTAANVGALMQAHITTPPERLGGRLAHLDDVLQRALSKDPGSRFRTCGEFAHALSTATGVAATRPRTPPADPTVVAQRRPDATTPAANQVVPVTTADTPDRFSRVRHALAAARASWREEHPLSDAALERRAAAAHLGNALTVVVVRPVWSVVRRTPALFGVLSAVLVVAGLIGFAAAGDVVARGTDSIPAQNYAYSSTLALQCAGLGAGAVALGVVLFALHRRYRARKPVPDDRHH